MFSWAFKFLFENDIHNWPKTIMFAHTAICCVYYLASNNDDDDEKKKIQIISRKRHGVWSNCNFMKSAIKFALCR